MEIIETGRDPFAPSSSADRRLAQSPRDLGTRDLALQLALPIGIVIAVLLAFIAIGLWRSDPLRLALLGGFATLGLFAVFALLAGHLRVILPKSGTNDTHELGAVCGDALVDGLVVTESTGRVVYVNPAFAGIAGPTRIDRIDPLRGLVSGQPEAEQALFRLFRAVERGTTVSEVIRLVDASLPPDGTARPAGRWLRLTARPLPVPAVSAQAARPAASSAPRILWQLTDVTAERHTTAEAQSALVQTLAHYSELPAGLLVSDASGRVVLMNERLRHRLDLTERDTTAGDLALTDVLSSDSAALVAGAIESRASGPIQIELTLLKARRFGHPVSALVDRNPATGGLSVVIFDRETHDGGAAANTRDVDAATFFHSAPIGIATLSDTGVITSANAALGRLLLINRSPVQAPAALILARGADADMRSQIEAQIAAALAGEVRIAPVEITLGTNKEFTRRLFFAPLNQTPSEPAGAMLYIVDATEQKALEVKFAQSQRMDAVGKLVGGIAHDFNNVLTAIIGWSELLLVTLRPGDPGFKNISNIKSSAGRAAGLVNQLLAFSRQQTLQPEVLQLGEVLSEQSVLITRLLGEKIDLKISHDRELWYVKADRTQFTQVIMNLAVNARDAMPDGGRLTIRTRAIAERDSRKVAGQGLALGEYVLVEVRDSGTGMPPDVKAKIFEPFYTTKGVGKGTGLGLSTVYGIVKQTGGYVYVDSEPGRGTTFRVYLPRHIVDESVAVATPKAVATDRLRDLTGTGRVLIVEDEDSVRSLTDEALRRQGYTVLQASTGREALDLMIENDFAVDLVVSDVIMPEMDGPTLLTELRKARPDIKVILVSGYPDEAFKTNLDPNARFAFLQKPYTLAQLAAKVKDEIMR